MAFGSPAFRGWLRQEGIKPPGQFRDFGNRRQNRLQNQYRADRRGARAPNYRAAPATVGNAWGPVTANPEPVSTFDNPYTTNGWFFDPGSDYGYSGGPTKWQDTDIANRYFNENPEAAWTRFTAYNKIDPMSAKGVWARGLFPRVREGWEAALATNPQLDIRDYLGSLNVGNMWGNLTARERGENPGLYAPSARTIARGYAG